MTSNRPGVSEFGQRMIFAGHLALWVTIFLLTVVPVRRARSQEAITGQWKSHKSGVLARLTSLFFIDEKHGWLGGTNGTLMYTEDGGESWKRIPLPESQSRETVRDLWAFNSGQSLLLGEYGKFSRRAALGFVERIFVLSSPDRGVSWSEMRPDRLPVTEQPPRIVKNGEKEVVLEPGKMKQAPDPVLVRMGFANDLLGWACGESGTIQATRDGGQTWVIQPTNTKKLLYDLAIVDPKRVLVAGAGGTLLQTEDGGVTWIERRPGITETIRAIEMVDQRNGWVAGTGGAILVTHDGGVTWQKQDTPTDQGLNDILFMGAEGWATGDNGTVLHTLDGGKTWLDESFDTHASLSRIRFVSSDTGWIVGSNGALYKFSRPRKNED